jgi:hypothetical protein
VGAAFERGIPGGARDLPQALRWYAHVKGLERLREEGAAALDGAACQAIANELWSVASERELAAAWYQRGIALGDTHCLQFWLGACFAADFASVGLEDARRVADAFLEEGYECDLSDSRVESAVVQCVCEEVKTAGAIDATRGWVEVVASLGSRRCDEVLALAREPSASLREGFAQLQDLWLRRSETAPWLQMARQLLAEADPDLHAVRKLLATVVAEGAPEQVEAARALLSKAS